MKTASCRSSCPSSLLSTRCRATSSPKLYGKPAETWTEPYETVGGGDDTTEMLEWHGARMVVPVEQFSASLHKGIAVIATRE